MELNKRCVDMLQYITNENDYVKINKLSQKYNVSDRTIRYDIERIESFLLKNGFRYMQRQHMKGVKIEHFMKMLSISKNTILKEMDFLEEWLSTRNFKLYEF